MKYLSNDQIENMTDNLLKSLNAMSIPVQVDVVACRLGINVDFAALGKDISGLLVIEDGEATIGVNRNHSEVRQRFTMAHEIGHYHLHSKESLLFIDNKYIAARDSDSSSGENRAEIQANMFAAALLMPKALLEKEIKGRGLDLGDDDVLDTLAKEFRVSTQAMAYRLSNLGLFD